MHHDRPHDDRDRMKWPQTKGHGGPEKLEEAGRSLHRERHLRHPDFRLAASRVGRQSCLSFQAPVRVFATAAPGCHRDGSAPRTGPAQLSGEGKGQPWWLERWPQLPLHETAFTCPFSRHAKWCVSRRQRRRTGGLWPAGGSGNLHRRAGQAPTFLSCAGFLVSAFPSPQEGRCLAWRWSLSQDALPL